MCKWGNRVLRIYVSIDKLNCPSPTSRVRWHQGPPASPCVKFRRFPRSTIPDNSAMCLNTQNRCIRREENAVCILGLDCTDWFHGSASTIHDCVSPCFTHFACCTALLCSRKRNAKSAYAFFFSNWNRKRLCRPQEKRGKRTRIFSD